MLNPMLSFGHKKIGHLQTTSCYKAAFKAGTLAIRLTHPFTCSAQGKNSCLNLNLAVSGAARHPRPLCKGSLEPQRPTWAAPHWARWQHKQGPQGAM